MACTTGQKEPAEAIKRILEEGGNAVDAAIAGLIAVTTTIQMLGSLTGVGYFMQGLYRIHTPEGDFLIDAMANFPSTQLQREPPVQLEVCLGESSQYFSFGSQTVAPSCLLKAAIYIQQRWGRIPWAQVLQPSIDLLEAGIPVSEYRQRFIKAFEVPIREMPGLRKHVGNTDGTGKVQGDTLENPEYLQFLRKLAEEPTHLHLKECYEGIGLEFEDIDFEIKEPLTLNFRGYQIMTVPPPNMAGLLLVNALKNGEQVLSENDTKAERQLKIGRLLRQMLETRRNSLDGHLYDPNIVLTILGSTEHISVVDSDGMCVAVTASNGSCSGVRCEKSGIVFNNILGEPDLSPQGFMVGTPGRRFPSGMAPTLVKRDGEVQYVLGASGSDRIRTSLVNIITSLLVDNLSISEAVLKGRVHYDGSKFHFENETEIPEAEEFEGKARAYRGLDMYFGGAHCISRINGRLEAKGDPRRDGYEFIIQNFQSFGGVFRKMELVF